MSGNSFLSNEKKFIKNSVLLMTTAVLPILCCASIIVLTFSFNRGSTTGVSLTLTSDQRIRIGRWLFIHRSLVPCNRVRPENDVVSLSICFT